MKRLIAIMVVLVALVASAPAQCPTGGCPANVFESIVAPQNTGQQFSDPDGGGSFTPVESPPEAGIEAACRLAGVSGTLIGKGDDWGIIWTCAHHIEGDRRLPVDAVFPVTRETLRATLLVADRAKDVAVYLTKRPRARVARVAKGLPRIGQRIWYGGFGRNGKWQAFQGVYRGEIRTRATDIGPLTGGVAWQGSARPGDSGGPAWTQDGIFSLVTASGRGETVGPDGLYVCQLLDSVVGDDRFMLPWNANLAKEQSRNESEVAREAERTRQTEVQSGATIAPSVPQAVGQHNHVGIEINKEAIEGLAARLVAIEQATANLQALPEQVSATEEQAAEAAGAAALAGEQAAGAVAAIEAVEVGLLKRIRSGIVGLLKGYLSTYGWLGAGVAGLAAFLIVRFAKKWVRNLMMPLAQRIDWLTDRIPGKWDDKLVDPAAYKLASQLSGQPIPPYAMQEGVDPWGAPYEQPPMPTPTEPPNKETGK